jgi:transposase InsO family protein
MLGNLILDGMRFAQTAVRSRAVLSAEILFLRKQLAFYQEHGIKPRRLTDSVRVILLVLSHLFNWKGALVIVRPETLIRWHRQGFRLFWRWKCRAGRPRLPQDIRQLIARMAGENPTWGQARIAAELALKLGIWVSPRTVRAYWPPEPEQRGGRRTSSQHWKSFVRNHARSILACDFLVAVTVGFRTLYVLLMMEVGSRRIVHFNVTAHPSAEWTLQQFREAVPGDHMYRFVIHDRDAIYSAVLDQAVEAMGVRVLKTPAQAPQANAFCERLIGTLRRECLDFLIPLNERHLRGLLREWVAHYNGRRPHFSLGPGIPEPSAGLPVLPQPTRHCLPEGNQIRATAVLGGLHHEYYLERIAA